MHFILLVLLIKDFNGPNPVLVECLINLSERVCNECKVTFCDRNIRPSKSLTLKEENH